MVMPCCGAFVHMKCLDWDYTAPTGWQDWRGWQDWQGWHGWQDRQAWRGWQTWDMNVTGAPATHDCKECAFCAELCPAWKVGMMCGCSENGSQSGTHDDSTEVSLTSGVDYSDTFLEVSDRSDTASDMPILIDTNGSESIARFLRRSSGYSSPPNIVIVQYRRNRAYARIPVFLILTFHTVKNI